MRFQGFDHLDTRVTAIEIAERFYDRLLPRLGLDVKRYAHVDARGDWYEASDERPYNAVEYHEPKAGEQPSHFIGFIEDRAMLPTRTRIAFRVGSVEELNGWHDFLVSIEAPNVEWSADPTAYPAIFFEDPCGTRLELCARKS